MSAGNGAAVPSADWRDLVEKLVKVERDVDEFRSLLAIAEKEQAELRAKLERALRGRGRAAQVVGEVVLGQERPERGEAPSRPVTHDYQRRHRALAMMKDKGGFLSAMEFARAERCPSRWASSTLGRLVEEGLVHRVSRGRYALGPAPKGEAP